MKYIINKFGIAIKKDCVSCNCGVRVMHHVFCSLNYNTKTDRDCPYWTAKEVVRKNGTKGSLLNAGKGGGKVKSPSYFKWLKLHRAELCMRTDETFKAYSDRMHALYKAKTGLDVYYDL